MRINKTTLFLPHLVVWNKAPQTGPNRIKRLFW